MIRHPLAQARIETFSGETGGIALLAIGGGNMIFRASTEAKAFAKADEWRDAKVAEHEASYVRRSQAAAERRAKRSSAQAVEAVSERTAKPATGMDAVAEADDGAIGAGKGEARLPDATGVESPSSAPIEPARAA